MPQKYKIAPPGTSNFAILDVKLGRTRLKQACEADKRTPVIIHGYIDAGKFGIGNDDGTSREFNVIVEQVRFGKSVKAPPHDLAGRPWLLEADLAVGMKVAFDAHFDCIHGAKSKIKTRIVKKDKLGFYVNCLHGQHYLEGQRGDRGELVGVYRA